MENKSISYRGKNYKVFTVHTDFGNFDVICVPDGYRENDTLAIPMYDVENGEIVDMFTVLTKNLSNPFAQSKTTAFVDTNNNSWALKFIEEYKLGKFLSFVQGSDWCDYPLYEFDLNKFYAD